MTRNITIHITIRSYKYIITNSYIADNHSVNTDPNGIANGGNASSFASVFLTYNNTTMYINIMANNRIRIDGNAIRMSEI